MGCSGCESRKINSDVPKKEGNILTDKIRDEFINNDEKQNQNTHGNNILDYQIIKTIGKGTTAIVYKVRSLNTFWDNQDQYFALKKINKNRFRKFSTDERL